MYINTKKHLIILFHLTTVLLAISLIGIIPSFIAMIAGEGALPFIICAISAVIFYFGMVFVKVIIDFYDTVVDGF